MCCGRVGAVHRHVTFAPCCILRGARCAAWRTTGVMLASGSADPRTRRSPPLLLPAPDAASFSTAAGSPDLGRLRHHAARLSRQPASKRELAALAKEEEAAARHREQLAELRREAGPGSKVCKGCDKEFELYLFPAHKSSPEGRLHLCCACRADANRRNRPTGKSAPAPAVSAKPCFGCGEVRDSSWYYADGKGPTGKLQARCIPCRLYDDQQRREGVRRQSESQEPVAEKQCRTCERMLPTSSFYKNSGTLHGLRNDCKECVVKAAAAWRAERKEFFAGQPPVAPAGEERICSACGTAKPWSEFHKDSRSIYGIHHMCKLCQQKLNRDDYRRRTQISSAIEVPTPAAQHL